ncbi:hypothetical protein ONA70_06440 [Micromonospora yasonensis]|uniref:hypothetical protein n=1 Tax=Micromonospora yasonensis TaxID=1128667 RepID=UPI00222FFBC7|nr:hypothetical protein [Micromonospora yasonensis]MCW3839733.1 hypothetical protein [Micromonospora yasonensis]
MTWALAAAGAAARFWYVARPLLAPAITVNLVLSLIRRFMISDQIWVTTQGGPAQSTDSLSTLLYRRLRTGFGPVAKDTIAGLPPQLRDHVA